MVEVPAVPLFVEPDWAGRDSADEDEYYDEEDYPRD